MAKMYIVLMLVAVTLLASCGDSRTTDAERSSDRQTTGAEDETALSEHTETNTVPGATTARVVDLEAKDHVYFPLEITATPGEQFYVNLINGGNEGHNIHIELPQAPLSFGEPVPTGESRKLLVTAPNQPGRYQVYCPVADHRERGMIATLIVE